MKRRFLLLIALCMSLMTGISSFAGQWMQSEGGSWYQNDDGSLLSNGWYWIDGNGDGIAERYYFDENGFCLINAVTPDGLQVNEIGAWISDGAVQTQTLSAGAVSAAADVQQPVQTQTAAANEATSGKKQTNNAASDGGTAAYRNTEQASVGVTVYITKTGTKYHNKPDCGTTKTSKEVSLSDARANGYEACKKCYR
ncbi:MAG: hypothetical protein Q4C63_08390 [Eubacteriales bacterium]|nr:hypothetical protein [Eubacteriales bacterium]